MKSRDRREEQYIHLVRLAWDLHRRGLSAAVDLPSRKEPVLLVPRTTGQLKVMAWAQNGRWFFTWGRGRAQRVRALARDAADRIWVVAR
ncbi:hypothetical protein [Sphaerisporangium sp. TRM90804]|uniref:hypothetical protein n=1 Tax=Sphaerisporangium sp. TRM90804 TaxID=3031113 RepID=UPI002446D1A9|nr:hypothetical protein [Sphaerisporangium sp. TRM90804]MDH2428588.1 hypothetical protein [Sphaerisporangium sp. TRM90804]